MRFLKIILGAGRHRIAPSGVESSPWQRLLARASALGWRAHIDRSRDDTLKPGRNMIDLWRRGGLAGSRDGRVVLRRRPRGFLILARALLPTPRSVHPKSGGWCLRLASCTVRDIKTSHENRVVGKYAGSWHIDVSSQFVQRYSLLVWV